MTSNTDAPQTPVSTNQNSPSPQLKFTPQGEIVQAPSTGGVDKWPTPKDGERPKDFVNRLLTQGSQPPPPNPTVESVIADVKTQQELQPVKKEPEPIIDLVSKKEPTQQTESQQQPQLPPELLDDDVEPQGSLSANYKLLRTHHKETKQNLNKAIEEKAKLEEELEKYKTGTIVPEVLQAKENEIARLTTYERLFNVKGTKAYKEQVVEPLKKKDQELKQLFKDYEIPESEIPKFMSLNNRADKNRFLSEHFDARGADQVDHLLSETRNIREKASQLESGSSTAIQELEAQQAEIEKTRDVHRKSTIVANAKDSWVRALMKIRSENQIKELIPKPNDPAFNEKIVTPILTAASTEYGKFVTHLANSGIQELTPEMAEYAARMSLLAHASAVATVTRDAALAHAGEMETATRVNNGYLRPQIGGGRPSMQSQAPAKQTFEQGVDQVLGNILSKR